MNGEPKEQQRQWLISYEYRSAAKRAAGMSYSAPTSWIELITDHPAVWVAEARAKLDALERTPDAVEPASSHAVDILRIYSAIEVPADTLTAAQQDKLS